MLLLPTVLRSLLLGPWLPLSFLSTLPSDLPSGSLLTHQFSSSQSTALVSSPSHSVLESDAFRVTSPSF